MKIHTHQKEEAIKLLKQLNLKYKIENKKPSTKNYENYNWYGLPSFEWDNNLLETTYIDVKLPNDKREEFFKAFDMKSTKKNYIHYKKRDQDYKKYKYKINKSINPKYPVYIISKGRWEKRLTADTLDKMGCPYKIVVEPNEYDNYVKHIDKNKILVLPKKYLNKNQGGIPARNFVWEHSKQQGYKKHWILDDNIKNFYRWNYNVKKEINSGVVFKVLEDYVDRFSNVGMASMAYNMDTYAIHIQKPIMVYNTKCYSCLLINTELLEKHKIGKWEGRYNEDVDLTIRIIEGGLSTIQFNNFLSGKQSTGMKGGNQDIYKNFSHDGFMKKFKSLEEKHPKYVKMTIKHKDKRPHHRVNYNKITPNNKPKLLDKWKDYKKSPNNYNMEFYK